MGGRGSSYNTTQQPSPFRIAPNLQPNPQPIPQQNPIADDTPNNDNTPVVSNALDDLTKLSDAQLAQAYSASQKSQMPNHLDDASDVTQKFVFHMGLNEKPMVLDTASFNQFMQTNGIKQSEVMARSINGGTLKTSAGGSSKLTPKDVADMMMNSRLNYVGGKHGGQAYGAGTYFDMNGGTNTGYASGLTVTAVLNPQKAKVISASALAQKARAFDRTHPQFAKATGGYNTQFYNNNMSVYALAMGYNVIKSGSYHNIISREALVYRK